MLSIAEINLSMQGSGIQNAVIIISAIIFSPDKCTVCIEEPENFLHPSQEVLVDQHAPEQTNTLSEHLKRVKIFQKAY
jgi:AAA15 family ATPase/GTPase